MGRRNKEKIRQEMFREGWEVLSLVDGFIFGVILFVVRLFEGWARSNPTLYMIYIGIEVFVVIAVIIGIINKFKYGGWVVVKYLLTFVGTYAALRILILGWI
jgi:ABC-type proline/glycine betaine transport system permease subunit